MCSTLRYPLFPYTTLFRSLKVIVVTRRHDWRSGIHDDAAVVQLIILCGVPATAPRLLRSRSEEHTSELQSHSDIVCRLLLEIKYLRRKLDFMYSMMRSQSW